MKAANLKVKTWLERYGFEFNITILPTAVRTATLAVAGTPESVFCMSPQQLQLITAGAWLDLEQS